MLENFVANLRLHVFTQCLWQLQVSSGLSVLFGSQDYW